MSQPLAMAIRVLLALSFPMVCAFLFWGVGVAGRRGSLCIFQQIWALFFFL